MGSKNKSRSEKQDQKSAVEEAPNNGLPTSQSGLFLQAFSEAQQAEANHQPGDSWDGVIAAWQKVVSLDPSQVSAKKEWIRVLESAGQFQAMAEALRLWVDLPDQDAETKAGLWRQLARVYRSHLHQEGLAIQSLQAALNEQPGSLSTLDDLIDLCESIKRWPDAVQALQKKAEHVSSDQEKILVYDQLGQMFLQRFGNVGEATRMYEHILALDPTHGEARALLRGFYEKRRDWEKWVALLKQDVVLAQTTEEKKERAVVLARMADDKLKRAALSIELWENVLLLDPDHLEAVIELEKWYERERQWDALAAVCERALLLHQDGAKRLALFQKLGLLYTERLKNPLRAIEMWKGVLAMEPENRRAQEAQRKLLIEQGQWDDLETLLASQGKTEEYVRLLERALDTAEDSGKIELYARMGRVFSGVLNQRERAIRAFEKIRTMQPKQLQAVDALVGLYDVVKDSKKRMEVLQLQLDQTPRGPLWMERAEQLARFMEQAQGDKNVVFSLWLDLLSGPPLAIDLLEDAVRFSEKTARETQQLEKVIAGCEQQWQHAVSVESKIFLQTTLARFYEQDAGDLERAAFLQEQLLNQTGETAVVLDALERLYLRLNHVDGLLRVYEMQMTQSKESAGQTHYRYRMAALLEATPAQHQKAISVYEEILSVSADPANEMDAWAGLKKLYNLQGDWLKLHDLIETQIGYCAEGDVSRHAELVCDVGQIKEKHLHDVEGALACYTKVLAMHPAHRGSLHALEVYLTHPVYQLQVARVLLPVYEQSLAWPRALEMYEKISQGLPADSSERREMCFKMAKIWDEQMQQPEQAYLAYKRLFEEDPLNPTICDELEKFAEKSNNEKELPMLYSHAVDAHLLDSAASIALLLRAGHIAETKLSQPEEAMHLYRRVLEFDPLQSEALQGLEHVLLLQNRWPDVIEIYGRKLENNPDPMQHQTLLLQIAHIWEERLQNPEQAVLAYQELLAIYPKHKQALHALERLLTEQGRLIELVENLEQQISLAESPDQQAALLLRVGELQEKEIGNVSFAMDAYQRVFNYAKGHKSAVDGLERLLSIRGNEDEICSILAPIYQENENWEGLLRIKDVQLQQTIESPARAAWLMEMAAICEQKLGDVSRAFQYLRRAFLQQPASDGLQDKLEWMASQLKKTDELCDTYRQAVMEDVPVSMQIHLWQRVAVLEEANAHWNEACRAYEQILYFSPDQTEAMDALVRLYSQREQYESVARVLRDQFLRTEDEQKRVAVQHRLAMVYEQHLHDGAQALEVYQDILLFQPDDKEALLGLQRLFDMTVQPAFRMEIADKLEPLYRNAESWDALVSVYVSKLNAAEDMQDRRQKFQQLADLHEEKRADLHAAFQVWSQAWIEQPSWERAHEEAERLARQTKKAAEWVHRLAALCEREDVVSQSVLLQKVLRTMARMYEFELYDLSSAEALYHRLVQLDSEDLDAWHAIGQICLRSHRVADAVVALRRALALVVDADDQHNLQLLVAGLSWRLLSKTEEAIEGYRSVLKVHPDHALALACLEQIYVEQGDWDALFETYQQMAYAALQDQQMAFCYRQMAFLSEWMQKQPTRAIEMWNRVLDIQGDAMDVMRALERLYAQVGRYEEVADVLRRMIPLAGGTRSQLALRYRLADVLSKKLHRSEEALWVLQEITEMRPSDRKAWDRMLQLYRMGQQPFDLAQALQQCIDARGAWKPTDQELVCLYKELAGLYDTAMNQPEKAIEIWRCVLVVDAKDSEAFDALERLFLQEARFEDCVALLGVKSVQTDVPGEKKTILLQMARMLKDQIGDPLAAVDVYKSVLALDPIDEFVAEQVEQLYVDMADWRSQTDFLLERAAVIQNPSDKAKKLLACSRIFQGKLLDVDAAFVVGLAAFEEFPEDPSVVEHVERLVEETGRVEEFFQQVKSQIVSGKLGAQTNAFRLKAAHLALEQLNRPADAVQLVQPILQRAEPPAEALLIWVEGCRILQRWEGLVDGLSRLVQCEEDAFQRVSFLFEMAVVDEFQLARTEQAIASYKQILEIDKTSLEAYQSLERIYRQNEMFSEWTVLLKSKTTVFLDDEIWLGSQYKLAELLARDTTTVQEAAEVYQSILARHPSEVPALKALAGLYEQTAQYEAQLESLEKWLDWTEDEREQQEQRHRLALAWEQRLGRVDRAIIHWEYLMQEGPYAADAFEMLKQLYRKQSRYADLVEAYRKNMMTSISAEKRVAIAFELAQVFENEMQEPHKAIEVYKDVLLDEGDHAGALRALARLYEETGDFQSAADSLIAWIPFIETTEEKAKIHYNIAELLRLRLFQFQEAEFHYLEVLGLSPGDLLAAQALAEQYLKLEEWEKAIQTILYAKEQARNPEDKVALLYRLAQMYSELLDEQDQAVEFMSQIQKINPEHVASAEFLAEVYYHQQRWDKAEPLLEFLLHQAEAADLSKKMDLLQKLAKVSENRGQIDKALGYIKVAYDLDSSSVTRILQYGSLLMQAKLLDQAAQLYMDALRRLTQMTKEEQVQINGQLAQVKIKQGDLPRTLHFLTKSLEIDPQHVPSLVMVAGVYASQKRWEEVVRIKKMLVELVPETSEKVTLLNELIEMLHERLHQPQQALLMAEQALVLDPHHSGLLHKSFTLYVQLEQWKKAVDVLAELARTETDGYRRGKFYAIAGNFCRDHLKSIDQALDYFNLALDGFFADPEKLNAEKIQEGLKSFEAIDKICTLRKDWQNQERSYRKMLKRLPVDGFSSVRVALWHALGEVYHSRLKDIPAAIQAFEVASQLDAGNQKRKEILGELYLVAGPDYTDKAIEQYTSMVHGAPFQPEAYQTLRRIYKSRGEYDAVWCICAVLVYLKHATAEEIEFFESYQPVGLPRLTGVLSDESWLQHLYHSTQDPAITGVLASVSLAAAAAQSQEHKRFGLKRKERIDLASGAHPALEHFSQIQRALNITLPMDLYFQPDQPVAFQIANTRDGGQFIPSILMGRPLLLGQDRKEWGVAMGLFVGKLRPEHFLRLVFPNVRDLEMILATALACVQPSEKVPLSAVKTMQQYMTPEMTSHLQWLVPRVISRLQQPEIGRFIQAVDLTCHRTALLVTADVAMVSQAIQREPGLVGGLTAQGKMRELLTFAVSPSYMALRKQLGVSIE